MLCEYGNVLSPPWPLRLPLCPRCPLAQSHRNAQEKAPSPRVHEPRRKRSRVTDSLSLPDSRLPPSLVSRHDRESLSDATVTSRLRAGHPIHTLDQKVISIYYGYDQRERRRPRQEHTAGRGEGGPAARRVVRARKAQGSVSPAAHPPHERAHQPFGQIRLGRPLRNTPPATSVEFRFLPLVL